MTVHPIFHYSYGATNEIYCGQVPIGLGHYLNKNPSGTKCLSNCCNVISSSQTMLESSITMRIGKGLPCVRGTPLNITSNDSAI